MLDKPRLKIAVVGAGISGLSAAWLLSKRHEVTVYERENRLGGHSHTVDVQIGNRETPVDTGFIVYNEQTYPNLVALFAHLGVVTRASDMSFGVSLDDGAYEYAGNNLAGLLAQPSNLLKPRFWSMLSDLRRFYRDAPGAITSMPDASLDTFLDQHGYSRAFRDDHLYPMAAAIWSTPSKDIGRQSALSFIRFCENHGLLKLTDRPLWRTVVGGSRSYVAAIKAATPAQWINSAPVTRIERRSDAVVVHARSEPPCVFDHVVIATHADEALALLDQPDEREGSLLGAFPYAANEAWLHTDVALMPRRRRAWSSWNYLSARRGPESTFTATYWMNRLQSLDVSGDVFVTLNPSRPPAAATVLGKYNWAHPQFDLASFAAQKKIWSIQGARRTWFCGAWMGAGFHEDGLQAGLAVAEALGGDRRPWIVANESGRIHVPSALEAVAT